MEKHVLGIFWRACVVLTTLAFTAIAANAQNVLLNSSFETPGTNFIYPADSTGVILTNTEAANWTPNVLGFRTATNGPSSGTYTEGDFGYTYNGINNSGSATTAHTGAFAAMTFGTFTNFCCEGSGVYQAITNGPSQVISNGQVWAVSGFGLNWSGNPMQSIGPGTVNFGIVQVVFLDASNQVLQASDGVPQISTNTALDTWISCTVTATAPTGTTQVRAYALHVGMTGALGSALWDDLSLTYVGIAPPPPPIVTNQYQAVIQSGNQICWPTVVNASYQPQSSDDNSTWANVGAPIPGDGTTNCAFGVIHKFYRVLQLQ